MQDVRTLLKREESYAIHALIDIAANPGTNASAIAEKLSMPKAFMAKVLRKLVEAGFVDSQMGRSGGVWLATPLREVTMLRVMEAMSGPFVMDTCQAEVLCATQRRKGFCRLNIAYHTVGQQMRALLEGIRLDTLADAPSEAPRDRPEPQGEAGTSEA
jgi:Rrf2 family protein